MAFGICQKHWSWRFLVLGIEPPIESASFLLYFSGSTLPDRLKNQTDFLPVNANTMNMTATSILDDDMFYLAKKLA